MVTLKCPFPAPLAAHAIIPAAPGPSRDGVGAARVGALGALGALHAMTARVCWSIRKSSRAWQALAHALSQQSRWLCLAHPYGASHCPFSSKAGQCPELGVSRVAKGGPLGWLGSAVPGTGKAQLFLLPCPGPSRTAAAPWVPVSTSSPIPHSSTQLLAFKSDPFPATCRILWGNSRSCLLCEISSLGAPGEIAEHSSAPGAFRLFPGIQRDGHKSPLLPPSRTFPPSPIINFLKDPINSQMEKYGDICTCAVKHIAHLFQMDVAIYKTYLGHEPGFTVFKQGGMM